MSVATERGQSFEVDLEELRPTLERIKRVAAALFTSAADVVILGRSEVWRSGDPGRKITADDPASAIVVSQDRPLWIPDLAKTEQGRDHPFVRSGPQLRFYAAAPIKRNAVTAPIGALTVFDQSPRPFDSSLAARLEDLAATVGSEFDRAFTIAGRTKILDRIQRSERRLALAAEITGMFVYEVDYIERKLLANGDADEFFGRVLTYQDVERDPTTGVHPEDRDRAIADWRESLRLGTRWRGTYRANRPDGQTVWVDVCTELIRDAAGLPSRLVGVLNKVTAKKKAEADILAAKAQAEAASDAKTQFLATMSHEIRTPLNGVLGMAQVMAADALPQQQRERLDVMRQAGESLLTILNDGLDMAKIEAGELRLEAVAFDFGAVARGSSAMFGAVAREKGLRLVLDIAAAEGRYLGDPTRLRQILQNLISNALKFTHAGEVAILAAWRNARLEIEVSDTGIGIPSDRLPEVFCKFVQVDASTTRLYGGTGLGLAICKNLVDAMEGEIQVESAVGKGTSFHVRLPLPRVSDMPSSPAASQEGWTDSGISTGLRVLAAEDNSVNQIVLRALLAQVEIEPTIVADGEAAVAAWRKESWDLILMDVQMPRLDGPSATRLIRAEEAASGREKTPILALTANAMPHHIVEYLACGMDGYVSKPVDAGELFRAIEVALIDEPAASADRQWSNSDAESRPSVGDVRR